MENFSIVLLIAATLRVATPLIFGTLGELFSEKAGVLNLGIEGTMYFGAFLGFVAADKLGSLWVGVLVALLGGMLTGLIMALLSVIWGLNQHVSGLGITLLLIALSNYLHRLLYGELRLQATTVPFPQITIFKGIPILETIFTQYELTYIAFALIPIVWWLIYRSNFGLNIRSVGENPEATDAAGINVYLMRTLALAIAGGFMAVGGAFLSIAQLGSFSYGIIAGRGWVCISLIIFANWRPIRVMLGALLFGGVYALQLRLQAIGAKVPYEAFLALPYIVTIVALTLAGRNVTAPAALLKAYKRE